MSGRSRLSPRAQRDLDEIWAYSVRHWGIDRAETYLRQIGQHIALAASLPTIGQPCPEIRAGYSRYPTGSHVLFYGRIEAGIEIVRILHARMDPTGKL